jgi:folate-binding protein YgfZ
MNQNSSYEALRTRAAVLDLTSRGLIRVSNEDRARLLHAMSTNAINTLQPGEGTQALFLNDKGRILAEFAVYCRDDDFLLDTEANTRQLVLEHLDHYIIMDVVELEDLTESHCVLAVEGPTAAEALKGLGATLPEASYAHVAWDGAMLAKCSYTGAEGFRIYAPIEQRDAWLQRLEGAGLPLSDAATAEIARLEWGKPRHGVEYTEQHLVHEAQLLEHVSFTKGCYLGQEIVERVRSRGLVNRYLVRLVADTAEAPAPETPVTVGEASSGKVMNAGYSPTLGKCIVWALLRREHVQNGETFTINGASATLAGSGLLGA